MWIHAWGTPCPWSTTAAATTRHRVLQCAYDNYDGHQYVYGNHYGPVWHSSASPVELFFRKQLHEQLHEWGREPCFGSFTMCLTMWEWVVREADQRVGQRVGCLAIKVVKLLVKLLIKLYQTGPMSTTRARHGVVGDESYELRIIKNQSCTG
jgi:hypothetical protein